MCFTWANKKNYAVRNRNFELLGFEGNFLLVTAIRTFRKYNQKLKMNNQPKSKAKLLGWVLLQLVALSSCYATYHLSSGEKYRNFFPVKDVHIVSEEELENNKFQLEAYFHPDTAGIVQYIYPKNIAELADSLDMDILLIFYYPNCSAVKKEFEIAQFAQENNIPFLMISEIYSPRRMKELYLKYGIDNKNQYIIPSLNRKGRYVLRKRVIFIQEVCPSCYDEKKDELIFVTLLKVSKNGIAVNDPTRSYGKTEFYTNWIKQQYGLKTE